MGYYPGLSNLSVITRILLRKSQKSHNQIHLMETYLSDVGLQPSNTGQPLEVEKDKQMDSSLEPSEKIDTK